MNIFKLQQQLTLLQKNPGFNYLHVDVMDNGYVPRYGIYKELIYQISEKFPNIKFNVHIMADRNLEQTIMEYAFLKNVEIIYFHLNAVNHPGRYLDLIRQKGKKSGIVLDKHQNILNIEQILQCIDAIMFMGINPGVLRNVKYQNFEDKLYESIKNVRDLCIYRGYPQKQISVDGGVTLDTIKSFISCGVTNLICGSKTLYNDEPLIDNIKNIMRG